MNVSANQNLNLGGVSVNNLTVSNPTTVTLQQNTSVANQLNLQNGVVDGNGFTLTAPGTASGVVRTSGFVAGALKRTVDLTAAGSSLFPVGTPDAYSPVTLTVNAGSGSAATGLTVSATAAAHPGSNNPATTLNRYWTLTPDTAPTSPFDAGLSFTYLDTDVPGGANENNLLVGRFTGGNNYETFTPTRDTVNNILTVAGGVTGFSEWAVGESTAVPVTLSTLAIE